MVVLVVLAGCETAKKSATSDETTTTTTSKVVGDPIENAKKAVDVAYAGTSRAMPTTGPKAQKDKTVWVIGCSNSIESCEYPGSAAVAAAKEIGWNVELQDGGLNTQTQGEKISSAVAAGVDGIVLIGIDCAKVQSQLRAAKSAGIITVYFYAYDCDDDDVAGGESLFTRYVNYGLTRKKYSDIAKAFGGVKGDYAIAKTDGKANVLNMTIDDYLVMGYINEGFNQHLAACKECKVAETVTGPQEEVLNGGLKAKVAAALQAHPEINVIHAPIDAALQFFVIQAVKDSGRTDILVIGGDGLPTAIEYVREGTSSAEVAFPHEWSGWAAIDTMNRIFAGEKDPVDTGMGWTLVDKDHNLPPSGNFVPKEDFKAQLKKIWNGQ